MGSSAEIQFKLRVSPRDLPELMDGDCSYEDFRGCLRSLEQINRWLLGYRPTLAWLKRLPPWICVNRCTLSMWAVAAAICCGRLQAGRGGAALLCS